MNSIFFFLLIKSLTIMSTNSNENIQGKTNFSIHIFPWAENIVTKSVIEDFPESKIIEYKKLSDKIVYLMEHEKCAYKRTQWDGGARIKWGGQVFFPCNEKHAMGRHTKGEYRHLVPEVLQEKEPVLKFVMSTQPTTGEYVL